MPMRFVNIHGEVLPDPVARKLYSKASPRPKAEDKSYHKGWRVIGIPPGALEEARDDHRRVVEMAEKSGGRESQQEPQFGICIGALMDNMHPTFASILAANPAVPTRSLNDDDLYVINLRTHTIVQEFGASSTSAQIARSQGLAVRPGHALVTGMAARGLGLLS